MSEIKQPSHEYMINDPIDVWFDGNWRNGTFLGIQQSKPQARVVIGQYSIPWEMQFEWYDIRERTIELEDTIHGLEWVCPNCDEINNEGQGCGMEVYCRDCKKTFDVR